MSKFKEFYKEIEAVKTISTKKNGITALIKMNREESGDLFLFFLT